MPVLLMLCVPTVGGAHARPGQPAPPFAITTFDKVKIDSASLRGQVVILNFWATWCAPCKKELPELDAYNRLHEKDGLRIFAVAIEDSVPDYKLRPLGALLSFPLAHQISGSAFTEMEGVPTNYVIDRNGVVRYAKAEAFDQETLDGVIGPLLAEPAAAANVIAATAASVIASAAH